MRPGSTVFLVLGVALLGVAGAAAFIRAKPVPMDVTAIQVAGSAPGHRWNVHAEVPQQVLAGQSAPIRLDVRALDETAAIDGVLLAASVVAPGGAVSPAGNQMGPAASALVFDWSIQSETPGEVEVIPSLTVRGPRAGDQVLWARSYDVEVRSVAGLDASELVVAAAVAGGLGVLFVALGRRERTPWSKPRADLPSSR